MAEPHVVSALQRTRAGIAADIARLEAELEQRRADLIHVDATLRLVDPAQAPTEGHRKRRPRRGWFDAGELPRLCLERLRDAGGTLSAREIAEALVAAKGLNAGDRATVHLIEKRVDQALRRRPGLVERVAFGPRAVGWKVV